MTDNAGDFALLVDPFSKPGMTSFAGIQFIVQLATSNTLIDAPLSLIKTNQSPPSLYTYDLANQARPDLAPAPSDSTDATITNTGHWSATLYADVDMQLPLLSLQELSDLWFPSGLSDSLNNTQLNPVNHSARFERTEYFPQPGNFKLVLTVDDAAQVYVDDKLVIDEKRPGGQRTNIGAIALRAGSHSFRVNYAQNGGAAALCFGWRENYVGWIARYFPNATLDGSPDSKRDEQTIDLAQNSLPFNMTPPPNNYSVIWDRDLTAKGEYELRLEAEGFARVYVDGMLVPALNRWESSNPAPTTQVCQLSNGPHHITVQYRNTGGPARIKFDYQLRDETKLPMTHAPVTCS